jgi:transporter family-2 protein
MNAVNSRFSVQAGMLVSSIVIHVVGLCALQAVLVFRREKGKAPRLKPHLYAGGFVGVGTLVACNLAYGALGASLATALALLGQSAFSLAIDASGFLGRKRYPLSWKKLPGIVGAMLGSAVMYSGASGGGMAGTSPGPWLFVVAFLAGGLPVIAFVLNSQLAVEIGTFRAARTNYLVGLATLSLAALFVRPSIAGAALAVGASGPLSALGGGVAGAVVVGSANAVYPRLPAFLSTLLIFSGQIVASLALDAFIAGSFSPDRAAGAALILSGLGINALLGRRA